MLALRKLARLASRKRNAPAEPSAPAPTPDSARKGGSRRLRLRLGINGRLILSFFAVAATTVASCGAAWLSYGGIEGSLDRLTGRSIPAITSSLQLSETTAGIVAQASEIVEASTPEQLASATDAVRSGVETAHRHLGALGASGVDSGRIDEIESQIGTIADVIEKLDAAQAERISLSARLAEGISAAEQLHRQFRSALALVAEDSYYNMTMDLGTAAIESDLQALNRTVARVADRQLPTFQTMVELRATADSLWNHMRDAARETDPDAIERLAGAFDVEQKGLINRMTLLEEGEGIEEVRAKGAALAASGAGPDSVFAVHLEALRTLAGAEALVEQSRGAVASLQNEVEALVRDAGEASQAAGETTKGAVLAGKTWLIAMVGASLLITALIAWLYVRRNLLARLTALARSMRAIAGGDLEAKIPTGGSDEITEMAAAVVVFRENAAEVKAANARAEAERENAARIRREELGRLAGEFEASVKGVVDAVSVAAEQMRGSAETMVATAEEASREATAVSRASEGASTNVQTVAAAAEELTRSVEEIGQQVAQSTQIAKRAVDEAGKTNVSMKELADTADKIGEIVGFINDIAGQTNLLALNATIEAARAGDAGKGFAVVASEVKTLASQTSKATEQIAAQIASIQAATARAVSAIAGIGDTIARVDEIAAGIAAAVEEQSAATQEIARNVQEAAAGTRDVSTHIGAVSGTTERTGTAAGEVLTAAGGLAGECTHLRQEVDRFLQQVRTG